MAVVCIRRKEARSRKKGNDSVFSVAHKCLMVIVYLHVTSICTTPARSGPIPDHPGFSTPLVTNNAIPAKNHVEWSAEMLPDQAVHSCLSAGDSCLAAGIDSMAETYYRTAATLLILFPFGNREHRAQYFTGIARLLSGRGHADSSVYFINRLLDLAEDLRDTCMMAGAYVKLATIWNEQEEPDKAIAAAEKGLHLYPGTICGKWHASLYYTLAQASDKLNRTAQTHRYLGKAIAAGLQKNDSQALSNAFALKGSLYLRAARADSALYFFSRQLDVTVRDGALSERAGAYIGIARAYGLRGQYSAALRHLNLAAPDSFSMKLLPRPVATEIYGEYAALYRKTGQYPDALDHFLKFAEADRLLLRQDKNRYAATLERRFRTAEKDAELLVQQLRISEQAGKLKQKNLLVLCIVTLAFVAASVLIVLYKNRRQKQKMHFRQLQILEQENEIEQLKSIMQGEEQERVRIAQELHDGIGGLMASIKMNFSAVRKQHPVVRDITGLNEVMTMLEETTAEVRRTAHSLMPNVLLRYNLEEALRIYCSNVNAGGTLHIGVHVYGRLEIEKKAELFLYRLLQELIQNITRHADAARAVVEISQSGSELQIIVEDNGRGFDVDNPFPGIGLHTLRSRIHAVQGSISIESAPGVGTTIHINLNTVSLKILSS